MPMDREPTENDSDIGWMDGWMDADDGYTMHVPSHAGGSEIVLLWLLY